MKVRPIDAKALSKQIKNLQRDFKKSPAKQYVVKILLSMLNDRIQTPTLDYEPVVHCKDCRYRYMHYDRLMCKRAAEKVEDEKHGLNDYYGLIAVTENHFCSYGVKMDEEVKSNANNNS